MDSYLKSEREIKGYVELEYSNLVSYPNYATNQIFPKAAPFCGQERFDLNNSTVPPGRISNNYASLEKDYFLLDGSFVLPYYDEKKEIINNDAGYISNEIKDEYELTAYYDYNIRYEDEDYYVEEIDGLTIYFKDNTPGEIIIKVYDTNENVYEYKYNEESINDNILTVNFYDKLPVFKIEYKLSDMLYKDRRLRISCIDLGLTDVIKNYRLKDFTITDEIDEFNVQTPSSNLVINIDNTDNKFNIANPKGIAKYLQSNRYVKPRIGILTEENGVQYKNIGTYYLNEWQNNSDNTTTLNCGDYLQVLKSKKFNSQVGTINSSQTHELDTFFHSNFDINDIITFLTEDTKNYYDDTYISTEYALEYLQSAVVYMCGKLFKQEIENNIDNRELNMFYKSKSKNEKLTLDVSLLEKPIYKQKEKIKNINITKYINKVDNQFTTEVYSKQINETGLDINIDNKLFKNFSGTGIVETLNDRCEKVINYLKSNMYEFDIRFKYIGNPNINVGSIITIETEYGERQMKILKHTLTFNGGLTGTIEGVGD